MRLSVCAVALWLACAVNPLAAQTNWPEKPLRLVVGFTAGSATDVTGRMFAQKFSEAWGQPVVVENVSGNSGAIGTDKVAGKLSYGTPGGGTLQPVIDKVRAESLKVLADPEMQKKIATLGFDVIGVTSEETRAAIAADIPKWAGVIKDANIKPGN